MRLVVRPTVDQEKNSVEIDACIFTSREVLQSAIDALIDARDHLWTFDGRPKK